MSNTRHAFNLKCRYMEWSQFEYTSNL